MHILLFSVVLFLIFNSVKCSRAPLVHLPVKHEKFVTLLVGSPGVYKTFRLDFSSNQTITLFGSSASYSKSYQQYLGTLRGSELFYIGCYKERFSTVYDSSKIKYDTKVPYHGILGLGEYSELWYHWTKYTISSTSLVLGGYDYSLIRKDYQPFKIQCKYNKPIKVEIGGDQYNLYYSPEDYYTRLPHKLYYEAETLDIYMIDSRKTIQLDRSDYTLRLPTGFNFSVLRKQPEHSRDIILGEHTVRQLVSYNDVIYKKRNIHPAYDLFDSGNSQPSFNSTTGILLTTILAFWIATVYTERIVTKSKRSTFISRMEVYAFVASLLILFLEHRAFKVFRFVHHHVGYTHFITYDILVWFIIFDVFIGTILFFYNLNTNHMLYMRSICVESVIITTLWITQVDNHRSVLDHLTLLFLASIYSTIRTIVFMYHSIQHPLHKEKLRWVVLGIYAILSQVFLIFYNISPFIDRFWYDFPRKASSNTLLWVVFSGIPILFLFAKIYTSELRNTITFLLNKKIQAL